MALTSALNTQGAVPYTPLPSSGLASQPISFGSTPQSKALNVASMQTSTPATLPSQLTPTAYPAPSSMGAGSPPMTNGMQTSAINPPPTAPTNQPVTSHTVTDVAGNTTKQTYQVPETGMLSTPSPQTNAVDNSMGTANPNAGFMNTSYNTGAGTPVATSAATNPQPTSQNTASAAPSYAGLIGTVDNYANPDPQLQTLNAQEQELQSQYASKYGDILNTPTLLNDQTGRLAALQSEENSAQANLAGNYTANLQQRGQNIGAAEAAAGLASPANENVTPPAGQVTTNTVTGQQYSNPIYEPAGSAVQAYSPQPNGTPGQPATAGQASQYTIKAGDSLSAIAAANGTTVAALQAANPQITNPNQIQAGSSLTIPAANTGNTAYSGGIAAGQAAAGQNQVGLQTSLAQARSVQTQINTLLQSNPSLNASPVAAANAVQAWAQSTAAPTGPYVNLLQDLQEYANTIAPVLGVGGAPTDNKIAIATQLVPLLASGQTIQQAIQNLDNVAAAKINAIPAAAQNASTPASTQSTSNTSGGTVSVGGYNFVQNSQGQWVAQ